MYDFTKFTNGALQASRGKDHKSYSWGEEARSEPSSDTLIRQLCWSKPEAHRPSHVSRWPAVTFSRMCLIESCNK